MLFAPIAMVMTSISYATQYPIYRRSSSARRRSGAAPACAAIHALPARQLGRDELGHGDQEPLDAVHAEVDLHARVVAAALEVDDDALAELRVAHDCPTRNPCDGCERTEAAGAAALMPGSCHCPKRPPPPCAATRGVSHFTAFSGNSSRKRDLIP